MKILTAQQMRQIDRLTVESCGIPYATLMETAGMRVVDAIAEHFGPIRGKRCAVFCGKGNNGGDGAVIARLLDMKGAEHVSLFFIGSVDETKDEARTNLEIINKVRGQGLAREGFIDRILFAEINDSNRPFWDPGSTLVIDALLGTGLTRPAEGLYAKAIEFINSLKASGKTIVSVDIPSGLSADSSHPIGPYVNADLTVSFTAPKIGNVLPPACYANGELVVASIGTPHWLIEEGSGSYLQLIEEKQIKEWLKLSIRAPDAHKGSAGDVLLIAGSRGKTGAAALTSETVLRAGAGLVTVATAVSAQALLITQVKTEVMTEALDELEDGDISHSAIGQALQLANKRTVLAIGPGLSSKAESTRHFVREFVDKRTAPVVIDADGLNALAPWPECLKGSADLPITITPHPGEMARLTGRTTAEVVGDRVSIAREFAASHRITVILKGSRTIIAAPEGEIYVNPTGNAGMATAGSGDVLTGLTAGLLAQHPQEELRAVIAAVYLHGLAGDIAASKLGMRSLIASDIIDNLSEAFLQVGGNEERGPTNTITTI